MSEFIKVSIKKNSPHFTKYKKYIVDNDWRTKIWNEQGKPLTDVQVRKAEFNIQNDLVKVILKRLKAFAKKTEGDNHLKIYKDFIKQTLKTIQIHLDRADDYTTDSDLTGIKDNDLRAEEIAFHGYLFETLSTIEQEVSVLSVSEDGKNTGSVIEFHENTKIAQLCMHEILYNEYPEIKRIIDSMNLDFTSPPKNEMHIYNPNPPVWNRAKHYFLQEKDVLQYYIDEQKKNESGVVIGGIHFEPWLYFHMNHFVTEIPVTTINPITGEKKIKKINKVPPLRDNEYYIIQDNYREARETGKILFIAATRRLFKSTGLASHLYHKAITGGKELLVAGGSTKDLGQIEKNIKTCASYINPAFAVNNISSDWTKKIPLGIRTKSNKIFSQCVIHVVNLDGGNNSEILAGYTPDALVIDEVLKNSFIDQLNGAKPSFDTPEGMLCTPILSGTGGDELMAKDGFTVLNDHEAYKVLPMNWDALERGMNKKDILWVRRDFGTFAPAAMSAKTGMIKIKSNLADYLGLPKEKELKKIEILITDWEKCNEIIKKDRESLFKDKKSYNKEIVYYPNDPTEIFSSGNVSPFLITEAKAHKQYLIDTGKWNRLRDLYRDSEGKVQMNISTKSLAEFPHKGDIMNAACLILEDPPTQRPKFGTYTAGFDDYKQENSDTSSLATFVVWKNEILGDPFSNKLVASLKFKPSKHQDVYEQWLMLMELYFLEGTCFGENEDFAIKEFLDKKHLTEKYLAQSLDFTQTFNIPNNLKRKFCWSPSSSKRVLFNLFVEYCNESFEVEQEDGSIITLRGVQRIDDISLLEEIIQYNPNLNVDLIIAAMGAYGFGHYLRSSHKWKTGQYKKEEVNQKPKEKVERTNSFYSSGRNRSMYKR